MISCRHCEAARPSRLIGAEDFQEETAFILEQIGMGKHQNAFERRPINMSSHEEQRYSSALIFRSRRGDHWISRGNPQKCV